MYKLFMALRYLRAHRIIYFSIAGVAIGIMVMIIVTSVMGGFSRDIRRRIRGMQSHIVVRSAAHDLVFTNQRELADRILKLPHVTGCAARLEYLAWLTTRRGVGGRSAREAGRMPDVQVIGIDPEQERGTGDIEDYFKRGEPGTFSAKTFQVEGEEPPALIVGSEITQARVTEVILQTARQGDYPIYLRSKFQIAGWFKSGMAEYDSKLVFMSLDAMQKFLRVTDEPYANVLAVGVDDYERHGADVRRNILELLHEVEPCSHPERHRFYQCGNFVIRTWEEERRTLLQAVEIEKGIQSIILFFIVIVAGFNIIAIYTLMVRAKTRDVGVLKALGGTPAGITSVFLLSGAACGLVGSIVGIGLGLLLSQNLNGIVDFVRITSRELNGLEGGRSAVIASAVLAALSLGALIVSWIGLYRRWTPWAAATAGAAGLLLAVTSWIFFSWIPGYEVREGYDWPIARSARVWISIAAGGLPILWVALRRLAEPLYDQFVGGVSRFVGTVVYSALGLGTLAAGCVSLALALTRPGPEFQGIDLFPRHVYYLDRVPVLIDTGAIAVIVGMTLVVSVIFSIYPAIRAARTDPIEALRDE
jgi:lipoprotein-releasing system permease protein